MCACTTGARGRGGGGETERPDERDNGMNGWVKVQHTYHSIVGSHRGTHLTDAGLLGDGPSHLEPLGSDHLLLHILHHHGVHPLGHVDELMGVVTKGGGDNSCQSKNERQHLHCICAVL